jgi:hypothetical protein
MVVVAVAGLSGVGDDVAARDDGAVEAGPSTGSASVAVGDDGSAVPGVMMPWVWMTPRGLVAIWPSRETEAVFARERVLCERWYASSGHEGKECVGSECGGLGGGFEDGVGMVAATYEGGYFVI